MKFGFYNILLFLTIYPTVLFSQILPPIQNFKPKDYGADNQNWMITEDSKHNIYIANNGGLLEYNGEKWNLYPSANNSIIRCVNVIDDIVYSGCYMDFGFWKRNTKGKLEYESLTPKLKNQTTTDETIWTITPYKEWILFQSYKRLYLYNKQNDELKFFESNPSGVSRLFCINNQIIYYIPYEGLFVFQDGKPKLLTENEEIKKLNIVNLFSFEDNKYLIITNDSGFYILDKDQLLPWNINANSVLKSVNVYSCIQLKNGDFIIGTISDGIIYLNKNGTIAYQINQKNGLGNNTALSLYEDSKSNIWIGLDNGIDIINTNTPFYIYNDNNGTLGTIYTSIIFKNYLYLGTNQGLFCKKIGDKGAFEFIKGTSGQVWSFFNYDNIDLLCGHHYGIFKVEGNIAYKIDKTPGAWKFEKLNDKNKELLLVGNYGGFFMLEKNNGIWRHRNTVENFNMSSRFFEIDSLNNIWVSHENKGVFKLNMDKDYFRIIKSTKIPELKLDKSSSLTKYNNHILYAIKDGIYRLDSKSLKFFKDTDYSQLIDSTNYLSGKLVVDNQKNLWSFSNEKVNFATIDEVTKKLIVNHICLPVKETSVVSGFENINYLGNNEYLLGTANGFIILDISKIHNTDLSSVISLNSVKIKDHKNNVTEYDLFQKGIMNYRYGILTIDFSIPEYNKFQDIEYQYKLGGRYDDWSSWSSNSSVSFENLSFGNYTFQARAKVGTKISDNIIEYKFKVKRPWYLSNVMIIFYLLLLFSILYSIHRYNKNHYLRKLENEQIENEKLIVQIKNEKLIQDIESKNKELALSRMNIIKKNELLNNIKKELQDEENNKNSVIKHIEKSLNNSKDWEQFVETFNNYDKGFLDKLKSLHPNLTHNDLRLCVYLRMNLTSKEISSLLNISVKSVETRRYRLRKRMNLEHVENLIDYILDI